MSCSLRECNFDIGEVGDMHHNPAKNVLHISGTFESAARAARIDLADAPTMLKVVKNKLYAARLERRTPFIDRTMYTAWNAMCISAYLKAGRVLDMPEVVQFGLKSLSRVLAAAWTSDGRVSHVVAYGERGGADVPIAGVLDDYAFLGHAALDAWRRRARDSSTELRKGSQRRFWRAFEDKEAGGFFDTERAAGGRATAGSFRRSAEAAAGLTDTGRKSCSGLVAAAVGDAEWAQ